MLLDAGLLLPAARLALGRSVPGAAQGGWRESSPASAVKNCSTAPWLGLHWRLRGEQMDAGFSECAAKRRTRCAMTLSRSSSCNSP